jgi:3-oxoacyl-[acyl-carrier-protein] synthase II
MKLGEGYGILVLERADAARKRGAKALAEVLGWGESADAHHLTQPHPEGDGAARAMAQALRSAGAKPSDIGLIAAHATGTPDNDAAEYAALARVFGDDLPNVPAVGFKSHLGHTLGGAGAVELILSLVAMREQTVPPCASVTAAEVEFPKLRLNTESAKPARIRATLNTSLGFGGANTCVVLGPAQAAQPPAVHAGSSGDARDVLITGVGVIVPGAVGNEAFVSRLSQATPLQRGTIREEEYIHLLNARRVRRMSEQVKLTLAATAVACQDADITDVAAFAETCGAVLGSTHGSTNYSLTYYGEIVKQGLVGANPMLFAEGVPNACSAHLSLMLAVKGACQTIIGMRTAGLDALRLAALRIAGGDWDQAIVAAAEEDNELIHAAYGHCGTYASAGEPSPAFGAERGFVAGSAAVALILESRESLAGRGGGRARGRVLEGASSRRRSPDLTAAAREVLRQLGGARHVISSANGTWVDRAELAAIRRESAGAVVSSPYGLAPETFSCGPLIGIAGTLLTRRMIPLAGGGLADVKDVSAATGGDAVDSVVALCTDYTGAVSGIRVGLAGL